MTKVLSLLARAGARVRVDGLFGVIDAVLDADPRTHGRRI